MKPPPLPPGRCAATSDQLERLENLSRHPALPPGVGEAVRARAENLSLNRVSAAREIEKLLETIESRAGAGCAAGPSPGGARKGFAGPSRPAPPSDQ